MRRLITLTITMLASSSFMATTVRAQTSGAHFQSDPIYSLDTTTGSYCVNFDEAGLGNTVTYSLTAGTATFTFQCFTKSGNKPQGEPNSISFSNLAITSTVFPRHGRFMGKICLSPTCQGAGCQGGGLVLKLIAVSYADVTFCDATNNICFPPNTPVPPALHAENLNITVSCP
jgi:hypothetical protein